MEVDSVMQEIEKDAPFIHVDNDLKLDTYLRSANKLFLEAKNLYFIQEQEDNEDLESKKKCYTLLLRFVKLVLMTIPSHKEFKYVESLKDTFQNNHEPTSSHDKQLFIFYQQKKREIQDLKQKCNEAMDYMEIIKTDMKSILQKQRKSQLKLSTQYLNDDTINHTDDSPGIPPIQPIPVTPSPIYFPQPTPSPYPYDFIQSKPINPYVPSMPSYLASPPSDHLPSAPPDVIPPPSAPPITDDPTTTTTRQPATNPYLSSNSDLDNTEIQGIIQNMNSTTLADNNTLHPGPIFPPSYYHNNLENSINTFNNNNIVYDAMLPFAGNNQSSPNDSRTDNSRNSIRHSYKDKSESPDSVYTLPRSQSESEIYEATPRLETAEEENSLESPGSFSRKVPHHFGEHHPLFRTIQDFKLLQVIGEGAFGVCSKMLDLKSNQVCVVKKIPFMTVHDIYTISNEILVLRKLHHPNIVTYYTTFVDDNNMCLSMEFCDGGDLKTWMENREKNPPKQDHHKGNNAPPTTQSLYKYPEGFWRPPVSEHLLCEWTRMISSAMDHVHSLGILHRDLKPSNIFLTSATKKDKKDYHKPVEEMTTEESLHKDFVIKIGDFGLSYELVKNKSRASTRAGTFLYWPPEVLSGETPGKPADVYSVGCILYELCMGIRHPGTGLLTERKGPLLEGMREYYSKNLVDLISAMVATNPSDRPTFHDIFESVRGPNFGELKSQKTPDVH